MAHDPYIDRANTKGVNPLVYWLVRAVLQPFFHLWFRVSRIGREHIPAEGGFIIAANHRSFIDPFIIGIMVRRPIYFVAKRELFAKRPVAWFLNNLGAFPINRGAADVDAMATARAILERGDGVLIFPEGTRVRPGTIGSAKRGVGRLALETGVPVVPLSIIGTEAIRRGWRLRPHKVRVRAGRPLTFPRVEAPSPQLAAAVTDRIWPCVALQWEWLGGTPPVRRAVVLGEGARSTGIAVALERAGVDVRSGDLSGADLVVLAARGDRLPALIAAHGADIPARAGVLVLARGLVADGGEITRPTAYVAARTPARAVACLGGPAGELEHGAALVVAGEDAGWVRQLADLLGRAGLVAERSGDVIGVELAGAAGSAAALAATTAGPQAAGAAAGRVLAEVSAYGLRQGARPETFAGLTGVGELVSLLAIPGRGDADEAGARALPLLAAALAADGGKAPVTAGLAAVVDGTGSADDWARALITPAGRAARPERLSA